MNCLSFQLQFIFNHSIKMKIEAIEITYMKSVILVYECKSSMNVNGMVILLYVPELFGSGC